MIGGALGAAPTLNVVLQIHFPEYPEEDKEASFALGDTLEIREDDRLIAVVKVVGIYAGPRVNEHE